MNEQDEMHKNPLNWKMGVFYYNPKDTRILLPKKNPMLGFTLNWARPAAYIALALIIAAIIFLSVA